MGGERRLASRLAFRNGCLPPRAHVRPGCEVVVVNLSSSGALVEGPYRFRPGGCCEMSLVLGDRDTVVRARVVRSFVARLARWAPVRYRAALSFECSVQMPERLGSLDGYELPADQPPKRERGVADTQSPRAGSVSAWIFGEFSEGFRRR